MQIEVASELIHNISQSCNNTNKLQRLLVGFSIANLIIVSLLGVLLRAYPFFDMVLLPYKNVLHGHSHFAFGGWVMPAILTLLLRCFPQVEKAVSYHHWRNIAALLLLSAYGMLIAFPLQGYGAVSICFSSLSIITGYYLAVVTWKAIRTLPVSSSLRFLKWGLFYYILSSVGPVATGPLIAMGKSGSTLYFDAIYFYLHFQYNGWFVFVVMAFIYQYFENIGLKNTGVRVFQLLNLACIPTFFLSVLWNQPSVLFNIIGGVSAALQLYAGWLFAKDVARSGFENKMIRRLIYFFLAAFVIKLILQVLSAIPVIAIMAYQYRNFVIGYLHLVLVGCISLFLIVWMIRSFEIKLKTQLWLGLGVFIFAFICSEFLIVALPLATIAGYAIQSYSLLLLFISSLLPVGVGLFGCSIINQLRTCLLHMPQGKSVY
jgi:hypothetical protein